MAEADALREPTSERTNPATFGALRMYHQWFVGDDPLFR